MDARHRHNLDPRLREGRGGATAQVFIEVANDRAAEWVKARPWMRKLVHVVDGYYTATIPEGRVAALGAHQGVIEVEAVRLFRPHLKRSIRSIRGNKQASGGGIPSGKGVVVGIVDYGLDFTQKDFQNGRIKDAHNPRGITRVAYLWDQQLQRKRNERRPSKYRYGVEYSSRDLDRALRTRTKRGRVRHNPLNGEPNLQGHGTHVAGIAAGNGETIDGKFDTPGEYIGVAPGATIVFVNLSRAQLIRHVRGAGGTMANSVNIAHGVAYCFEKADELGMPCVVNLSLGSNGGGHDGNMALEWIIDALVQKSGRAVVLAAGNEDGAGGHAAGRLRTGRTARLKWAIGDKAGQLNDPNPNELEVWYPRGSAIKVSLIAPDGKKSREVTPGRHDVFTFARGGERLLIRSDRATAWNGAARIYIELREGSQGKGIRFGTWMVKLVATEVAPAERGRGVRFDAWIERTLPPPVGHPEQVSRFEDQSLEQEINLTTPSTGRRSIVVASYENDVGDEPISKFSSRGPTRDQRRKPELAAPGNPVLSTNACAGQLDSSGVRREARVVKGGTSMAAPHVTGVVARMLGLNAYLTAEEIRDILLQSAAPPHGRNQGKWNKKWGYGRLDAARAIELLEELQQ